MRNSNIGNKVPKLKKRFLSRFEELQITIGAHVRWRRKNIGWTQQELAKYANIDVRYLGALERGEANPTVKVLCDLGEALEALPTHFFQPPPKPSK